MNILQAQQLLSDFGASLGLPELSFDETGHCALVFDDVGVNLDFIEETQDLLVYSLLGMADEAQRDDPAVLLPLLHANYFGMGAAGGQIGIDKASGAVTLSRAYPLRLLDLPELTSCLQAFVNTCEYWKVWMSLPDEALDAPPAASAPFAHLPHGVPPTMIRA